MKRFVIYCLAIVTLGVSSCGKNFLNITPIQSLSGNNYWQTKDDVAMFVRGLYSSFRNATMQHAFFPATGDLRCTPFNRNTGSNSTQEVFNWMSYIKNNDLDGLYAQYRNATRSFNPNDDYFGFLRINNWAHFYNVISKANIAVYEIENLEDGVLSEQDRRQYIAEAVFMRNLSYFFLVRLFGDVPYYTEAYHSSAIPRTPMLEVLTAIDADMAAHYKNLPWTHPDPTEVGNRAMRGAAIALMMHANMWNAGFTDSGKLALYERVAALGKEVMEENGGAYELLPLDQTKDIYKGRTKEGLFEITQNYNYGEMFHLSAMFADNVLRYPYKSLVPNSYIHYELSFMEDVYPRELADERKSTWFEEEFLYAQSNRFVMIKNINIFVSETEDGNPDDNMIVFRYPDVILMRAEALAELGTAREAEAIQMVNIVRNRANATILTGLSGEDLKDFIWWERVRELMGEGHFYYDLVRTKKVMNSNYTSVPMPIDAFYRGGWTWPIAKSALDNNPYVTLNNYWN